VLDETIARISSELQKEGYLVDLHPRIPGVQALLYSCSLNRMRLGAAKVEDHFLFVDWDNAMFARLDHLQEAYRRFSRHVNRGFRTPHVLRVQIPNLTILAVSQAEFPEEAIRYARTTSLNPWYGGEVGQIVLVEIEKKQVISLESLGTGRYPRPGAFALGHAADLIRMVCGRVLSVDHEA
jgi:hypothetical protein